MSGSLPVPVPAAPPPGGAPGPAPAALLAALGRMRAAAPASLPGLGAQADGLAKLKTAVGMLQTSLPSLGIGSEVHKAVVKAIQALSPHLPSGEDAPKLHIAQLLQMADAARRNAVLAHLLQMQGGAAPAPQMTPTTPPGA